ncbi:MAG: starvation-sensing protein RspA [Gammaproteobacteria bacterium TMED133]|nr:MAG: starvation-sensing protein RspA [Gammaproteobacteria bacterium TMED133]
MNRRNMMKLAALGTTAGALNAVTKQSEAMAATYEKGTRGLAPLKITDVKVFLTIPQDQNLVVVKIETSEPGLYGLGCASYRRRPHLVAQAIERYVKPFLIGKDPDLIEDLWQTTYNMSYWRNGSIFNNALSGMDQALWDIKGKRANMPVHQLLGGKVRFAVDCYAHARGDDLETIEKEVKALMKKGFRHIRIQQGGYGSENLSGEADFEKHGFGAPGDISVNTRVYLEAMPEMFAHVRKTCGKQIELLHDIHERIQPIDAIRLIKELDEFDPFFIEDPFPPETHQRYFEMLREQTSCPIAMGELFNNPTEWVPLISDMMIDFIRVHVSHVGGLSVARKISVLSEMFNVRTAWHGHGVSPVGHAANAHLDLVVPNFGIQEVVVFDDAANEVFPGCPEIREGYMHVNEAPGFGVDFDEKAAAKYPVAEEPLNWPPIRKGDGTVIRP